jgi:hypothetical protein
MTHDELYKKALVTIPPHKQAELKAIIKALTGSVKHELKERDLRIVQLELKIEELKSEVRQLQLDLDKAQGVKAAANIRPFPAAGASA